MSASDTQSQTFLSPSIFAEHMSSAAEGISIADGKNLFWKKNIKCLILCKQYHNEVPTFNSQKVTHKKATFVRQHRTCIIYERYRIERRLYFELLSVFFAEYTKF